MANGSGLGLGTLYGLIEGATTGTGRSSEPVPLVSHLHMCSWSCTLVGGQVFERTMALEMVDVPNGLVFTGEVCVKKIEMHCAARGKPYSRLASTSLPVQ